MKRMDFLLTAALMGLLLLAVKEASAYDLSCKVADNPDSVVIISTPDRAYSSTVRLEDGRIRTLRVKDTLQLSEVDDYASYTDGKNRVTYWMKCERF